MLYKLWTEVNELRSLRLYLESPDFLGRIKQSQFSRSFTTVLQNLTGVVSVVYKGMNYRKCNEKLEICRNYYLIFADDIQNFDENF